MATGLQLALDVPLPAEIAVGAGTALFVCGTCFHRTRRIASLALLVDGDEQPVIAHSMPRLDFFAALHPGVDPYATEGMAEDRSSAEDPRLHGYRSGFWGVIRIAARPAAAPVELGVRACLDDGSQEELMLQRLGRADPPLPLALPAARPDRTNPLVAVCMATYDPPLDLLRIQLDSIRAQTHPNWVCVISDDCSPPGRYARLRELVGEDPRFLLSRSERRRGFYLNFERALALAPHEATHVALADQDDRWYPEKLETLLGALGSAELVYSDARVVDERGQVLADTYWSTRENNHHDLLSLLVANSVTGAASLMPRRLLEDVLPFPPAQFAHYHDHWLGLVALSLGRVEFVARPLYDYVQHGAAALGHETATQMPSLRDRVRALRRDPHERVRMWRLHYFVDVARLTQLATVLQLRLGERMSEPKRRVLESFIQAERSLPALARLAARGARELLGRGRPQTLGAEWMLSYAFAWRRLLGASVRDRPQRRLRLDAVPPPDLVLHPGRRAPASSPAPEVAEKIAPLRWAVSDAAPARINILIPTIDLAHFFGGYIAKLNLARRLVERGRRVRLVTVDPVGALPPGWRAALEAYSGLTGVMDRLEVEFGRESSGIEVSRQDRFIATTWWTAHVAGAICRELGSQGGAEAFLYLIQEYEPFTFPMGSYAALAAQSYDFPHRALFSTELLREYFRAHRLGVYGAGPRRGDRLSASFQNAITPVAPLPEDALSSRDRPRLLFYARPEAHAARNMFELGLLALDLALQQGAFAGWELNGVGTVWGAQRIAVGAGHALRLIPRAAQSSYGALLREHDVGLALMYTPHPSLVPIEMAAAGMVTVTNSFENKTAARLQEISRNLIAAAPTVEGVAAALRAAAARAGDHRARIEGSAVRWSRTWDEALPDELVGHTLSLLDE